MNFNDLNLLMKYAKEYGHEKIRIIGMTDTEHTICTFLFAHEGMSQDDAASALRLDKTTVARALSSLEGKGFVVRSQNSENRRKNVLSITEAGKRSIAGVVNVYDEWLSEISSCLSKDEQKIFDGLCVRLLNESKKICEE